MLLFLRQVAQSQDKSPKRTQLKAFSGETARYIALLLLVSPGYRR